MYAYTHNRFNSRAGAGNYAAKFNNHWVEQIKHRSELRLLQRLLSELPASDTAGFILDLPCGHGRFFPTLAATGRRVIECDFSQHMLDAARHELEGRADPVEPFAFMRGSALALPFADAAFDLVVSVRLCHHLPTPEERSQYVREILRVTRKWAIFTYLDRCSFRNVVQSWKRRLMAKRPKSAMSQDEVARVAVASGFKISGAHALSRLFSGQRYTITQRVTLAPETARTPHAQPIQPAASPEALLTL